MRFKGTGNVIHLESNFFLKVESQHRVKKSQNMHLHLERTQDAVSRKKKIKVETCRICMKSLVRCVSRTYAFTVFSDT